jgi:hypothetical protein
MRELERVGKIGSLAVALGLGAAVVALPAVATADDTAPPIRVRPDRPASGPD